MKLFLSKKYNDTNFVFYVSLWLLGKTISWDNLIQYYHIKIFKFYPSIKSLVSGLRIWLLIWEFDKFCFISLIASLKHNQGHRRTDMSSGDSEGLENYGI